jgi:aminopeptidase
VSEQTGKGDEMADPRIQKLADVLVNYSVAIQPRDRVMIRSGPAAAPMARALVAAVLDAGGHPLSLASVEGAQEVFFQHASDDQLLYVHEPYKTIYETYEALISVDASTNTKALSNIPPEKMRLASQAQTEIYKVFMERLATGSLRWVGCLYPTNAFAQDGEMSLAEYEDFVYGACLPDPENPVKYWEDLSARQQKLVDWLAGKKAVRVEGPGVDLRLSIDGRSFVNCDGKKNMPDGEIFTGPVEDSVEGHVRFSYPSVYMGRKLEGIELWFEKGRVVKSSAEKGEDFLTEVLETDEGARFVGEFAIGTNEGITQATGHTLFDEKIVGSFHMAVGAGMPETGSVNQSAIHWDMICDLTNGGKIWVDDELFYENGKFVSEG